MADVFDGIALGLDGQIPGHSQFADEFFATDSIDALEDGVVDIRATSVPVTMGVAIT